MIESKYAIGDQVRITVADDMFTGRRARVRSWKRHRKPYWRISYILDIDDNPMKWGAGPYSEDELTKEQGMHITQITVSYGETQSLPEYSNVKPSLTITATLDADDNPTLVEAELWLMAKQSIHAQIDLALEVNGRAAKYDPAPRYQVLETYWDQWSHKGETKPPQYVVILPNEINPERGAYAQKLIHAGNSIGDARRLRYDHARRIAAEVMQERGYTLLDCSNGDLTAINLAIGAPESNPEVAPTEDHPF